MEPIIKEVMIQKEVADAPYTIALIERLGVPTVIIKHVQELYDALSGVDDPISKGKEILYICKNKGKFVKKCPGTKFYNCCGYMILHIGSFCTMDCAYCILQSYFHPPVLQYFVNKEDMTSELTSFFSHHQHLRIGTGEFTDSLIWEPWIDMTDELIPLFARQSSTILELKTKTTEIQNLNRFDHNKKTIMAWSLNTERIIASEERHTTTLEQRLSAAKECEALGYPLAFHFDPLILYEGCEKEYEKVLEQLFSSVSENNIVWISLGTFRFMPDLKQIIQHRFPDSKIVYGEFISGLDNKMRYFKPLRLSFYRQFIKQIRQYAPNVLVYFCMEDDEVWHKTMGFTPKDKGGLANMLDQSAIAHCELKKC